ncbi:unnamed protein product [Cylicocyclus nassatus]|uniref:Uncharacterized protein n=1 Tax=Cylicocyclus nassatus TaxID=53992 RepID=A0AA36GF39_CYLNA|nr:unnamed protein product [Cylicocyclus nassatus]
MLLSEVFQRVDNREFARSASRSVGRDGCERRKQFISPLPHNFVDTVYSVRNPSLQTARSGSDNQRLLAGGPGLTRDFKLVKPTELVNLRL